MKKIILLLALCLGVFAVQDVKASHAAGGELLYELVPNTTNTYKFIFKFYRDCGGISAPTQVEMCYNNSCAQPVAQLILALQPGGGQPVSSGCPGYANSCNSSVPGALPGYQEYIYTNTLVLWQQCNQWKFWVSIGARNAMSWLGGGNLYIEATFNNTVTQNDNSPYFSIKPVPYCCINTPFTFNNGAIDINGDSLVFSSIQPRTAGVSTNCPQTGIPTNCAYTGFGAQTGSPLNNPIPTNNTFSINSQTGFIKFTPTAVGDGVITILCQQYRNGQLIGTVMRDIQTVVLNCSPGISNQTIDSNSVVNALIDTIGQVKACVGDSLYFCFNIVSTDTEAVLVPYSNIAFSLPGATISFSNTLTDSIVACVSWPTTFLDTGLHVLIVNVIDSSCKPPGILYQFSYSIPIFIDYSTIADGDTIICKGESAPLSVTGGGPFTWTALPGGSPTSSLSCTNCDNPIATPTVSTYYVVQGCTFDTVYVEIVEAPTLTITPDTTTCVNADLQLQVVASPGNQVYNYSWLPITYLNNATISNPIVQKPLTNTSYTVTVVPQNFASCSSTATVNVSVLQGFSLDPYDDILCDGESTSITGNGDPQYTYNWVPTTGLTSTNTIPTTITPTVPGGSYTITATYPGCPDSSIIVDIIMDPVPVVDAGPDREMCLNDTMHIHSSVIPDTIPYTISWVPGADLNDPTSANPIFDGAASQLLTVTYTTTNGCFGSDDMAAVVNNVDFLQIDGDRDICPGDTTNISVLGGLSYFWYPNYYISDIGNVTNVTVYPDVNTTYYVVGIDINGCYDTAKATIKIAPGSVVDAGDDVTIYPGESVQLYANGNCSYFNWFPPSGLSSTTVKNPIASPTVTTKYIVNAQTENGCPTVDSVIVRVSPETLLDLPNAFSPGSGTSLNDKLKINKRGLVTLKSWKMFNRWGELVFSTTDIEDGWDGRYKGEPQPLGTYVYYLEAETSTGKRFYKQGTVTLIR